MIALPVTLINSYYHHLTLHFYLDTESEIDNLIQSVSGALCALDTGHFAVKLQAEKSEKFSLQ